MLSLSLAIMGAVCDTDTCFYLDGTSGAEVHGRSVRFLWHSAPDGGATFKTKDNGWIYVSNSERYFGGVSALEFNTQGILIDAFSICSGTHMNCAGGSIEGMKWLSCE